MAYWAVKVAKGKGGHGGPVIVRPTEQRPCIGSQTGGGIHPVAAKIAELTGAEAVDLMKKGVKLDQLACVVIDCGGSARCGVYPAKKVPTVHCLG